MNTDIIEMLNRLCRQMDLLESRLNSALSVKEDRQEELTYLSIQEAAEYIKKSVSTVYKYTCECTIPFLKSGSRLLFKKSDLDEWIETNSPIKESKSEKFRKRFKSIQPKKISQ